MVISRQGMEKLTAVYRTVVLYHKVNIDTVLELRQFVHEMNLRLLNLYWTFSFYEHPILFDESVLCILKENITKYPIFIDFKTDKDSSEWDDLSQVDTEEIQKIVSSDKWREIDELSIINFDYKKDLEYIDGRIEHIEELIENRLILTTKARLDEYKHAVKSKLRDYKINLII